MGPAAKIWNDACQLCRQMEYKYRLASILERLRTMFQGARMTKEMRVADAELATLKSDGGKPS